MNAINIDETNRLVINPFGFNLANYKVDEAKTEAPNTQTFTCKEPTTFGTDCFGDPDAFNRLQEILHQRESETETPSVVNEEQVQDVPVAEENFVPTEPALDIEPEPAFC